MNRRYILGWLSSSLPMLLAGCGGDYKGDGPPSINLNVIVLEVRPTTEGFELTTEVSNVGYREDRIEGVHVLAFSESGRQAGEKQVGVIEEGGKRKKVSLACSEFPEIVTAKAATSVCEDLIVDVRYWVGTDRQKGKHIPDELSEDAFVYDITTRKCGESLPPERLVNSSTSSN